MTEFCLDSVPSKSNKTRQISSILLSNLYLLCSFIFLHPLCFSLVAFFFPCLLKLLSFLSPLFITTSLLLALLLASPKVLHQSNRCHKAVDTEDDEFQVYKTVFEASAFETGQDLGEEPVDKCVIQGRSQAPTPNLEAYPAAEFEVKEGFLLENDGDQDLGRKSNKDQVKKESIESDKSTRRSKSKTKRRSFEGVHKGGDEYSAWPKVAQDQRGFDSSLASSGAVRKEKEWKRTLACKLFEERHNRGGEGMDMLWETYDTESCKMKLKITGKGKKGSAPTCGEEDNDDDDDVGVQICCLQALKFSAAKKMGRPSMVRFSKAVKGIGWLHRAINTSKKA